MTDGPSSIARRQEAYGEPVATFRKNGKEYQAVVVTDSSGNEVTQPTSAVSATQGASTSVSSAATLAASNSSRKGGYIHFPAANTDSVYVSLNSPATTTDMEMLPGSSFFLTLGFGGPPITNAVYGVAKSGTQTFIVVQG